ncbi:MAG: FAD-dependent oxidoreductase, partial [Bradyrhizobiaceae bacterium]
MNFLPSLKLNRDRAEMISEVPFRFVRSDHLARLENDQFDLLIIGGGVTGAYAALDASLRGFRVALVEKADFASGTSSKSSKMVHGGLRYIEQGNLSLVR